MGVGDVSVLYPKDFHSFSRLCSSVRLAAAWVKAGMWRPFWRVRTAVYGDRTDLTDLTAVYVDVYGDVYVYGTDSTAVYGDVDLYAYVDGTDERETAEDRSAAGSVAFPYTYTSP